MGEAGRVERPPAACWSGEGAPPPRRAWLRCCGGRSATARKLLEASMAFADNVGVTVNPKGEMKESAITGPIGKSVLTQQMTLSDMMMGKVESCVLII
ncbi:unnamed protein product [Urochloa humidicola]